MPDVIDVYDDPTKEVAAEIQTALDEGVLGFKPCTVEHSRIRSCCSWLLEGKPEKILFANHLSSVLLEKGSTAVACSLSRKLAVTVIKREPVVAEQVRRDDSQ